MATDSTAVTEAVHLAHQALIDHLEVLGVVDLVSVSGTYCKVRVAIPDEPDLYVLLYAIEYREN